MSLQHCLVSIDLIDEQAESCWENLQKDPVTIVATSSRNTPLNGQNLLTNNAELFWVTTTPQFCLPIFFLSLAHRTFQSNVPE